MNTVHSSSALDKPYPLMRNFVRFVLPLLLVAVVGLTFTLRETIATGIEAFHAEREMMNAEAIIGSLQATEPTKWRELLSGNAERLKPKLLDEISERGIFCLSMQDEQGKILVTVPDAARCKVPPVVAFDEVLEKARPELHENIARDGYWTSLMSIHEPAENTLLLIAISRHSRALEAAVGTASTSRTWIFGGLFLLACLVASAVVFRAQNALNVSFEALNSARVRLQRFVSKNARQSAANGQPTATRHHAVVLFADLRNFSGYAEMASLEETAALVDHFVTGVTHAVEHEGGDVDKLLGDGMLAWFEGEGAADRAIRASIACIESCKELARRPGIGLFEGEVFAATLGRGDRMDFTILGKSVNLASRLCTSSAEDEITAPSNMNFDKTLPIEPVATDSVTYKNHADPIEIVRYGVVDRRQSQGISE